MSKLITLNESDCKCYTCQESAQDCNHNNNFFRNALSTFKIDDPDNNIYTIDLHVDDVKVMGSCVPDEDTEANTGSSISGSMTGRVTAKDVVTEVPELDRQHVAVGKLVNIYANPDITEHFMHMTVVRRVIDAKFRHNCGYWLALIESTGSERIQFVVLTDQVLHPKDVQKPDATEIELKTLEQNNEPVAAPVRVLTNLEPHRQSAVLGSVIVIYANPDITEHPFRLITVGEVLDSCFRYNCGYWLAKVRATNGKGETYIVLTDVRRVEPFQDNKTTLTSDSNTNDNESDQS